MPDQQEPSSLEPPALPPPDQPYPGGQPYQPGQPWQQAGYPGYPPYQYYGRRTNGLAIASLVVSIAALPACLCYGVPGILLGVPGAIMGHVARRQIQERGEEGDGIALTGLIVGWVVTGLSVIAVIAIAILVGYAATHEPPE